MRFAVRVQPRASRSEIDGVLGDAIKVRLGAPVEGAANEELVAVLAEAQSEAASRTDRDGSDVAKQGRRGDGIDAERVQGLVIRGRR